MIADPDLVRAMGLWVLFTAALLIIVAIGIAWCERRIEAKCRSCYGTGWRAVISGEDIVKGRCPHCDGTGLAPQ